MESQYDKGLALRRQALGQEYVDKALAGATEFTQPIQEAITRRAWGETWQRDGLDLRTRSLVTIAMLIGQGSPNELKAHVRGALSNGATVREIQEVLLHGTVYRGFPAAVDAFRVAAEVIDAK
ncbi:MAG: 4-carboxymuconolactone decarboxylase [Ramlibacter sp.]|jgi:4-carboxymuconolactone decarboxylase|nr:4-carboxymuconolactone decarboxylase [Ramlibacter sp.]